MEIFHHQLDDTEQILFHIDVVIDNVGTVIIKLSELDLRIQQIIPLPARISSRIKNGADPVDDGELEILWDEIDSRHKEFTPKSICELEPGEKHKVQIDFILPHYVEIIYINCHIKNKRKRFRSIGWDYTVIYDLGKE